MRIVPRHTKARPGETKEQVQARMRRGRAQSVPAVADMPCPHRGELLRVAKCDLCSTRGQPLEVFACALESNAARECSYHRKHSQIPACATCEFRLSLLEIIPMSTPSPQSPAHSRKRAPTDPESLWAWTTRGLLGAVHLVENLPPAGASEKSLRQIGDAITALQGVLDRERQPDPATGNPPQ